MEAGKVSEPLFKAHVADRAMPLMQCLIQEDELKLGHLKQKKCLDH